MPKVFICYRRDDSAYVAQQIYGELKNHFDPDSVVFDVDSIPLGRDFREYLNVQVGKCDVLLAVMGNQWLHTLKERIDDPKDFVRIEIQAALESKIPVVPVLVGKACVPGENELPTVLSGLAYMQAAEVRAGPDRLPQDGRKVCGEVLANEDLADKARRWGVDPDEYAVCLTKPARTKKRSKKVKKKAAKKK